MRPLPIDQTTIFFLSRRSLHAPLHSRNGKVFAHDRRHDTVGRLREQQAVKIGPALAEHGMPINDPLSAARLLDKALRRYPRSRAIWSSMPAIMLGRFRAVDYRWSRSAHGRGEYWMRQPRTRFGDGVRLSASYFAQARSLDPRVEPSGACGLLVGRTVRRWLRSGADRGSLRVGWPSFTASATRLLRAWMAHLARSATALAGDHRLELGRTGTSSAGGCDAGVIETRCAERPSSAHPCRGREGRHPHPISGERHGLIMGRMLGRRDIVKDSPCSSSTSGGVLFHAGPVAGASCR